MNSETLLKKNPIFNPNGDDSVSNRSIIKGNTTGLFNLNEVKYQWAKAMYQVMVGNFWLPEKVSGLGDDAIQYKKLTDDERRAYDGVISFLTFLDSLQTVNLPNFSEYITSPEVNLLLSIQSYQEAIHSQSYATILETVVEAKKRNDIYYFFRDDKMLLERNTYIGNLYQNFIDTPNDENFFTALIANFLLESIYFYNGFAFFDTLVYNQKMVATGRMISYIRRDELTHVTIFANIIKTIEKEFPEIYDAEKIKSMMKIAVDQEIKWTNHIIGNNIGGISKESTEMYTKWLANRRMNELGLNPLYPEVIKSPYKHLEHMEDNNAEKTNFFESTVVNYTQSTSMNGTWDF